MRPPQAANVSTISVCRCSGDKLRRLTVCGMDDDGDGKPAGVSGDATSRPGAVASSTLGGRHCS